MLKKQHSNFAGLTGRCHFKDIILQVGRGFRTVCAAFDGLRYSFIYQNTSFRRQRRIFSVFESSCHLLLPV